MDGKSSPRSFGQDEVNGLLIGLLMYGNDFSAIRNSLLPQLEVDEIVQFYCDAYRYTKASAHVQKLELQGFQPGSLLSGNMRIRLIANLTAATGRSLRSDKAVLASFKGYDACSLSLVDLVGALTREVGSATFSRAIFEEINTCGVEKEQLSLSELFMDWETLDGKIRDDPTLFIAALWPALASAGWKQEAQGANTTEQADAVSGTDNDNGQEEAHGLLYVAPDAIAERYLAVVGEPLRPCRTPEAVIEALLESGQPVPAACIRALREQELEAAVEECLLENGGPNAPHRHAQDPTAKKPGTPTTNRRFMCANCSISTSTVWRSGNAGLTLCNACGMFYNKHDHEHRPEHLIASARAKVQAQQAAAATGAVNLCGSPLRKGGFRAYTPDMGITDGELSDDAGSRRGGSFAGGDDTGDEEEDGSRRPRRRRRAQVSKWLATDDYLMLDGPLRSMSNQDLAAAASYPYDDGRYGSYDAQRGRYTASPNFARTRRGRPGSNDVPYYNRSRSIDPDYYGWEQGQDDYGYHSQYQIGRSQDYLQGQQVDGASMDWENDAAAAAEEHEAEWQLQRPLEDMESLLSRILLQSPSDASDSSAADALVAMSHSSISQQEQRRLYTAISCNIRAASGSPAPASLQRSLPPALVASAATAGLAAAADAASGAAEAPSRPMARAAQEADHQGWDASVTIKVPGRMGLAIKPLVSGISTTNPAIATMSDSADEMQIDGVSDFLEQKQQTGDEKAVAAGADGFEQVWAKLQPVATGRGGKASRNLPITHAASADYDSPPSWYGGGQQYHDDLQHCHSAPSHYGSAAAEFEYVQTAGATGNAAYSQYGGGHFGQQYLSHLGGDEVYYQEAGHTAMEYHEEGGSRTGTPKHAGKGANNRRSQQVDEDYPEPKSKNRIISRFGAEHKQQQDYSGGSRSQPTTPQKREKGSPMPRSIRRTPNGEPQRCANCNSDNTCLWRRDIEDPSRTLCNACGIYKTNNGIDRPTNGLFPSWKNGKERVVRRNVARPIFKPYKHQVLSAEDFKAQRQNTEEDQQNTSTAVSAATHSSNKGAGTDAGQQQARHQYQQQQLLEEVEHQQPKVCDIVHPGALGLLPGTTAATGAAGAPAAGDQAGEQCVAAARSPAAPLGVDPSILTELTKVARASMHAAACEAEATPTAAAAASSSSNDAAVLSAAVAAATSAAKARVNLLSSNNSKQGPTAPAVQAATGDTAPVPAIPQAATAAAEAAPAPSSKASVSAVAHNRTANQQQQQQQQVAGEFGGIAHSTQLGDGGILNSLIQQAWTHALRMNEPVMLPTGHKVFPNGQVVKCQISNELGLVLPSVGQETSALSVGQMATGFSSSSSIAQAGSGGSTAGQVPRTFGVTVTTGMGVVAQKPQQQQWQQS